MSIIKYIKSCSTKNIALQRFMNIPESDQIYLKNCKSKLDWIKPKSKTTGQFMPGFYCLNDVMKEIRVAT